MGPSYGGAFTTTGSTEDGRLTVAPARLYSWSQRSQRRVLLGEDEVTNGNDLRDYRKVTQGMFVFNDGGLEPAISSGEYLAGNRGQLNTGTMSPTA